MDLSFTPAQEEFRVRLRRWLTENLPAGWGTEGFPGFASEDEETAFLRDWQARLHRAGWCGLSWPPEYGGAGATPIEQAIYDDETARPKRLVFNGPSKNCGKRVTTSKRIYSKSPSGGSTTTGRWVFDFSSGTAFRSSV